jgi:hypothetical protein
MSNTLLPRLRPVLLIAVAAAWAGCSDNDTRDALSPPDGPGVAPLAVQVEASSALAPVGDRIALAIRGSTGTGRPLGALQGTLTFDASRLTYVGHDVSTFQIVNASRAGNGELRIASLDAKGLPDRAATLVFTVKQPDYLKGMKYAFKEAGTVDPEQVFYRATVTSITAGDLGVPADAVQLSLADWEHRLTPSFSAASVKDGLKPSFSPGSIIPNLKYGDATLDGNVNILDALDVANTSVGSNALINGTDSPNRDRVIAANVFPANTPGLGEPGDAVPPGVDAGGSQTNVDARSISILDALDIANEAVGNDRPVPGAIIPGRAAVSLTDSNLSCPITSNVTLGNTAKTYLFPKPPTATSVCNVSGASLTIGAGVTVKIDSNTIVIDRNSTININGTLAQPVTLTCLNPTSGIGNQNGGPSDAGCWGGLYVNGNAPVNNGTLTSPAIRSSPAGSREAVGEGGTGLYGGGDPADNSGTIRFLRIFNAGTRFSPTNERNGLTLQGVGSGTTVDYVWEDNGLDDGVEFFGGTVRVKHLLVTRSQDDGFDWVGGFRGKAQFVIVRGCDAGCDRGIEADNFGIDGNGTDPEAAPRSAPTLYNFTLVGSNNLASSTVTAGVILRQNTGGFLRNFLVFNYKAGLDIDQPAGATPPGIVLSQGICDVMANDSLIFRNSLLAGNTAAGDADNNDPTQPSSGTACGPYTVNGANGTGTNLEAALIGTAGNSISTPAGDAASFLVAPFNNPFSGTLDFRAKSGTAAATTVGATPPSDGFFDPTATYLGGVAPSSASGGNIPWYAGWTTP